MTEILPTASYLRATNVDAKLPTLHALYDNVEFETAEAPRRIWELLETPQTIETLCRVLSRDYDLPRDSCSVEVRDFLARLYREGLIQLSPDS